MWRWGLVLLVWLAVPPAAARAATPVVVGHGPLLALAAHDGVGYAVVERESTTAPFALVRSTGKGAGRAMPFGGPGAENVDVAATPAGVEVAWSRPVSSSFEFFVARASDLGDPATPGLGTGPPQLAGDALAYPDRTGDAMLGDRPLTADAPEHRHLPLDAAGELVLDLDQQRTSTQLRLLGPGAPAKAILSVGRLADVDASLSVTGGVATVAFTVDGRTFLATERQDGWTTRRIATGTSGRPAVAGRHVAYARDGAVYLDRTRLGSGGAPQLAADGSRLYAGWTHRATALLVRLH
jgi:hypothetical protein